MQSGQFWYFLGRLYNGLTHLMAGSYDMGMENMSLLSYHKNDQVNKLLKQKKK